MAGQTYGYVRVSTRNQKEDRQLDAMREYGVEERNIVVEKRSGKDFDRPKYQSLLKKLKPGDTLVIKSIDRLGRNYTEILEQWRIIGHDKDVAIVVLDMPMLSTHEDKELIWKLVTDLVLQIFSYVAQTEREDIRRRQREGIDAAKARGVSFGRPKLAMPPDFEESVMLWKQGKLSVREASGRLGISGSTFFRRARDLEQRANAAGGCYFYVASADRKYEEVYREGTRMDLFSIGSWNSYAKNARLQTRWSLKKASGDVKSHTDPLKPRKTREASMYQQIVDRQNEEKGAGDRLGDIMNKLNAGQKLTKEEKEYLKAKAPEVYRMLENSERDQKEYEKELKRCKTKEEVQRVKLSHMGASLTRMESVKNDPNIPKEKKELILAVESAHVDRLDELERKFVKRGDYARLPTEAEKTKAEREEKAAKTGVRPESERRAGEREKKAAAEKAHDADKVKQAEREAERGADVESPERRKLRRAKLRAAFSAGAEEAFPTPTIDREA